jgi:hypothetical protein
MNTNSSSQILNKLIEYLSKFGPLKTADFDSDTIDIDLVANTIINRIEKLRLRRVQDYVGQGGSGYSPLQFTDAEGKVTVIDAGGAGGGNSSYPESVPKGGWRSGDIVTLVIGTQEQVPMPMGVWCVTTIAPPNTKRCCFYLDSEEMAITYRSHFKGSRIDYLCNPKGMVPYLMDIHTFLHYPVFNECRKIMGTQDIGEDDALRRTLLHFVNSLGPK